MPALTSPKIRIGTVRADGFVFRGYDFRGGKVREHWISPKAAARRKLTTARLSHAHWNRIKADPDRLRSFNKRAAKYAHASRRRDPTQYILARAKARSKRLGLPFDLVRGDIVIPQVCPVLGIELRVSDGSATDSSPELDRIIPGYGYVRGNVIVVSRKANRIKSNATIDELIRIAAFYSNLRRTPNV